jgi:membrane protease YdiL (CAAX protease family)
VAIDEAAATPGPVETPSPATPRRVAWYLLAVLGLFAVQELTSRAGTALARLVPTDGVDPTGWWARMTIHHLVLALVPLVLLLLLRNRIDTFLRVGDRRLGLRWVGGYVAGLTVYLTGYHVLVHALGIAREPALPGDPAAWGGYLGFELLLTGPAEELMFRALTMGVLAAVLPVMLVRRWRLPLELPVATVMFVVAHIAWSPIPFSVQYDAQQLAFVAVVGTIEGLALLRTRSVLYPMAMHSLSNVLVSVAAAIAG